MTLERFALRSDAGVEVELADVAVAEEIVAVAEVLHALEAL